MFILYRHRSLEGHQTDYIKCKKCSNMAEALRFIFKIQFSKEEDIKMYIDDQGRLLLNDEQNAEVASTLKRIVERIENKDMFWLYQTPKRRAINMFYFDEDESVVKEGFINLIKYTHIVTNAISL